MIDFKQFIFVSVTIAVLSGSSAYAMFRAGHYDQNAMDSDEMNEIVTGFNKFTLAEGTQPFFSNMKLRGYITLQLINDTLSLMKVSIKRAGSDQILSTTDLPSGTFYNTFIPENIEFELTAERTRIPHAKMFSIHVRGNGNDLATRITRWNLKQKAIDQQIPERQPVNLFNIEPDPDNMLAD